nr:hypothetical protein [Tanacetum cinerariifolium]
MNQNTDSSGFDQIQTLQYPHAQPEDTNEFIEDLHIINEELAEYINSPSWNHPTFFSNDEEHYVQYKEYLENPSNEIAASNFNQEKEGPPQDSDIRQLIGEECCIKDYREQKKNMEDMMLELIEVCRQKEFYCMHNNVDDLIESALNSKLLSINLKSQRLDKKKQEEPEYPLSMGYEHLSTTTETELDEVINSTVEKLVPIPSECEVTSDNKSKCDLPVCEDSPTFDDHPEILSDSNDDDISSDYDAFEDIEYVEASALDLELVSLEEENSDNSLSDNSSPEFETFSDHTEETRSGSTTTHANNSLFEYDLFCFEIDSNQERLTSVVKNDISNDSTNDPLLEEVDLFLALDNSIPLSNENIDHDSKGDIHFLEELLVDDSIPIPKNESSDFDYHDDPSFPRPPLEPPNVEFFFDLEPDVISVVMNNINKLNENECFDPGGEIDVFKMLKMTITFPSYLSFEFFYRISSNLRFLLYFSSLGVKTPF